MPIPSSQLCQSLLSYVAIDDAASRETSPVTEVFTGHHLVDVPRGTAEDVSHAMQSARLAGEKWAQRSPRQRAAVLVKLEKLVDQHRSTLVDIIQAEGGKNRASANEETIDIMLTCRWHASQGRKALSSHRAQGMLPLINSVHVHYQPKGVVGVISPWNFPLTLSLGDAISALLAGNAVVIKPDSLTPLSALYASKLLQLAGLDKDLFQVIPGSGAQVGTAIAQQCDYLMFTGSSATGKLLAAKAGERLIGFSGELGGKNAMLVDKDADLQLVADVARRALYGGAGQVCVSIERIYVHQDVAAELEKLLKDSISAMTIGASYGYDCDMGSLASQNQVDVVMQHIDDALAAGARVVTGGRRREDLGPYFVEPTLLADVPPQAICHREETFGPLCALYPVTDMDEAIHLANDTEYGLNSSVFSRSERGAHRIAQQLRTGTVVVNEGYVPAWGSVAAPMGGMGISGIGRRHGTEGILKYTEAQTVAIHRWLPLGGVDSIPAHKWNGGLSLLARANKLLPGRMTFPW